jgi:hypothetical protein
MIKFYYEMIESFTQSKRKYSLLLKVSIIFTYKNISFEVWNCAYFSFPQYLICTFQYKKFFFTIL